MTSREQALARQLEECLEALTQSRRENELLRQKVELLIRRVFGSSSERLDKAQLELLLQLSGGTSPLPKEMPVVAASSKRSSRPNMPRLPENLPVVEEVIEPEPVKQKPEEWRCIGEEVSEQLDYDPARFVRRRTIRKKYVHRLDLNRAPLIAPLPERLLNRSLPAPGLLAQILVGKYCDHLPLYRQEAIYARDQVELDRSLMAQWMGKVGFELQPLADYVLERIKQGERVFADETTLPTLAPGSGKTQKAWLWAYARDDRPFGGAGPPMVAYRFEDSRSGDCVARHLKGYTGILQVDGYSAYTRLAKTGTGSGNETVTLAGCWAHLRRRFYELHINGSSRLATQTVTAMAALWKIEGDIRGVAPAARMAARQQRSATMVAELFDLAHFDERGIVGERAGHPMALGVHSTVDQSRVLRLRGRRGLYPWRARDRSKRIG